VIITENELRKVIRQIILEESRLDEGPIWDKLKKAAGYATLAGAGIAASLGGGSVSSATAAPSHTHEQSQQSQQISVVEFIKKTKKEVKSLNVIDQSDLFKLLNGVKSGAIDLNKLNDEQWDKYEFILKNLDAFPCMSGLLMIVSGSKETPPEFKLIANEITYDGISINTLFSSTIIKQSRADAKFEKLEAQNNGQWRLIGGEKVFVWKDKLSGAWYEFDVNDSGSFRAAGSTMAEILQSDANVKPVKVKGKIYISGTPPGEEAR
jgi:hypothetical protein